MLTSCDNRVIINPKAGDRQSRSFVTPPQLSSSGWGGPNPVQPNDSNSS